MDPVGVTNQEGRVRRALYLAFQLSSTVPVHNETANVRLPVDF